MSNEGTEEPQGPFDLPPDEPTATSRPGEEAADGLPPGEEAADNLPPAQQAADNLPPGPDEAAIPPPPPPPRPAGWSVPPPPVRRLVRDPGASLGGVASGLSQHYGIDVSIIRLAFVLFTLISGVGLLLYILAWIIIPKGDVWPPAGARSVTNPLSSRELAIGAILMGLALVVFVSGGSVGEVIVPLLLIGGGVWLLNQSSAAGRPASSGQAAASAAGPWPAPDVTQPQDTVVGATVTEDPTDLTGATRGSFVEDSPASASILQDPAAQNALGHGSGSGHYGGGAPPQTGSASQGAGAPGRQTRRRRRPLRIIFFGFLAMIGGFFALIIAIIIAAIAFGEINFDADGSERYAPQTAAELPTSIQFDAGELVVDLSELDGDDFADATSPQNLDVELNFGEVTIIVPEDLPVEIDAAANLGDVDVFDRNDDGVNARVSWSDDDAAINLDVNVGFGAVVIERP